MNRYLRRRTALFIVHIWLEYLEEEPPCWRGQVQSVPSGELFLFRSAEEMLEVVKAGAEAAAGEPPTTS